MNKQKRIVMALAALGGLGLFLLSGRNANAAEVSQVDEFGNALPGGSSGANTFTSLLAKALSPKVDTSVQDISGVDSFAGETNSSPGPGEFRDDNIKLAPQATVEQSPPTTTLFSGGGGSRTGFRVALK